MNNSILELTVTLEEIPLEELKPYSRDKRFRMLKKSAQEHKDALEKWVVDNSLTDDILEIRGPNVFNLLFVSATLRGREALVKAPGVVDITINKSRPEKPLILRS